MLFKRPRGQPGRLVGPLQPLPEGDPLALGVRVDARDRAVADAALGGVEDPAQGDRVGRVDEHPQVGQRVTHLAALVEPHPADDLVGQADADERLLEHPGLGVGAVEDRHVGRPRGLVVGQPVDLLGDEARLVPLVVGDVADDAGAVAGVGPQLLGLAALVVPDHGVRGVEDRLRRAVVLLEQDRGGVGEVLLEVHDVADVGAAERVDRLVGVADDHQLGGRHAVGSLLGREVPVVRRLLELVGAQLVDQGVLRVVGVLVLVDQHVAEPAAVGLADVRELLEQVDGEHDQVVEVEGVGLAQAALVHRVRRRHRLLEAVAGVLRGVLGVAQVVLVVADPVQDGARLVALGVEVEVLEDERHQPLGVGGVVDREARLEAQLVDLLAQDPHAGRVEGADPHDPRALADQRLDALLHLGGGLVGEGDRQDRARVRLAHGDQPGDPPGEHPGLARPGAGHHEQRGAVVHDRRALRLVEPLEQLVLGRLVTLLGRPLGDTGVLELGDRQGLGHDGPTLRPPTPWTASPVSNRPVSALAYR